MTSHRSNSWSGDFGGRLVGRRHDDRPLVGVAVELPARSLLDIGVVALAVAPARLLAVDHRPAQAAHLVVGVEGREVVAMAAAEARRIPRTGPSGRRSRNAWTRGSRSRGRSRRAGTCPPRRCAKSTSNSVLPRYSGASPGCPAGQTSSVVKRLENSISCHRSERASPGASTSWCHKWVRRSALP